MDTLFKTGTVLELPDNSKAVVIDSYSIDAKNIRTIAVTAELNICILNFNLDTGDFSYEPYYDTVKIAAILREY